MKSARQTAFDILCRIERDRAYSTLSLASALKGYSPADKRDVSLVTNLVYGVIERKITLDYNLSLYLRSGINKLHPGVLTALRLGAYQILFADKIPVRAAVNESVELVKSNGQRYAAGLVNAVLRKVGDNSLILPDPNDTYNYLSVRYSCPELLVRHFIENYGTENAVRHLEASLCARPLFIRHNVLKCSLDGLKQELDLTGAGLERTDVDNCYILKYHGDVTGLSAFAKGFFYVQDMSSQICASLLDPKPGQTVVDCCASPGGKSFTAAQFMDNKGKIISCDMYEHKTELIKKGAEKLGIKIISTVCCNAQELNKNIKNADAVLCDVPCSGLGVIGRKPEIRYKDPHEHSDLPETQYAILSSCSQMVKPGGTLIYSTCTLDPKENEEVCDRFLNEHDGFNISSNERYKSLSGGRYINIFASEAAGDGFFIARFERKA